MHIVALINSLEYLNLLPISAHDAAEPLRLALMCDGGTLTESCLFRRSGRHQRGFCSAARGCVCDIVLEINSSDLSSVQGVWVEAGQKIEMQRKNGFDAAFMLSSSSANATRRCLIASRSTALEGEERF